MKATKSQISSKTGSKQLKAALIEIEMPISSDDDGDKHRMIVENGSRHLSIEATPANIDFLVRKLNESK